MHRDRFYIAPPDVNHQTDVNHTYTHPQTPDCPDAGPVSSRIKARNASAGLQLLTDQAFERTEAEVLQHLVARTW